MSFEDIQKQWQGQFAESPQTSDPKNTIELLDKIRQDQRRFRLTVGLLALRDMILLFLCLRMLQVALHVGVQNLSPKIITRNKEIGFLWLGAIIVLGIAVRKFCPPWAQNAPSATEGPAALPERVRTDGRRFDAMLLWRDLREIIAAVFLVSVTVLHARHAQHYPILVWIAAGLFSIPGIFFVNHRLKARAQRAAADDTLLGTLTHSIEQTRRQARLLDNVWRYIAPVLLGSLLLGPIQGALVNGRLQQSTMVWFAVFLVLGWGVCRRNRWAVRHHLRPRLDQLEKLKADLSVDAPLN